MEDRKQQITDQVNREYAEMEKAMEAANPGLLEVLEVYGGLEDAIRDADAYLQILNPVPAIFSATNSSNSD
jgi:hypothetical protein